MTGPRIAYVINSLEGGGAALPVPAILAVLRGAGAQVRVLALTRRDGRALPAMEAAGLDVAVREGGETDHVARHTRAILGVSGREGMREERSDAREMKEQVGERRERIDEANQEYGPLRDLVRTLQARMRRDVDLIDETKTQLDRTKRFEPDNTDRIEELERRLADLQAEVDELTAQIPENWDSAHADMKKLLAQENRAYLTYRRTVDGAYEPIIGVMNAIRDADALTALLDQAKALAEPVEAGDYAAAEEAMIAAVSARRGRHCPAAPVYPVAVHGMAVQPLQIIEDHVATHHPWLGQMLDGWFLVLGIQALSLFAVFQMIRDHVG